MCVSVCELGLNALVIVSVKYACPIYHSIIMGNAEGWNERRLGFDSGIRYSGRGFAFGYGWLAHQPSTLGGEEQRKPMPSEGISICLCRITI